LIALKEGDRAVGAAPWNPVLHAQPGACESGYGLVDIAHADGQMVDACVMPHDLAREFGAAIVGDKLDAYVLSLELGNSQAELREIATRRHNCVQHAREGLDRRLQAGTMMPI
jgi:hypothetical protein